MLTLAELSLILFLTKLINLTSYDPLNLYTFKKPKITKKMLNQNDPVSFSVCVTILFPKTYFVKLFTPTASHSIKKILLLADICNFF